MEPHPDFLERSLSGTAKCGPFNLNILSPEIVEEDYAAVVESSEVLLGIFGHSWPENLTLEKNLEDLKKHEAEFQNKVAFAWVIRSLDGEYLGCAYFVPKPGLQGEGEVFTWIRKRVDRLELLKEFNSHFDLWLGSQLPTGYSLSWKSNDYL